MIKLITFSTNHTTPSDHYTMQTCSPMLLKPWNEFRCDFLFLYEIGNAKRFFTQFIWKILEKLTRRHVEIRIGPRNAAEITGIDICLDTLIRANFFHIDFRDHARPEAKTAYT